MNYDCLLLNYTITIYIIIPFIIIAQLIFSGVFVKYEKLHQGRYTSSEFVPVIGDMMAARWSFEALAVEQFKNNKYEMNFFASNIEKRPTGPQPKIATLCPLISTTVVAWTAFPNGS